MPTESPSGIGLRTNGVDARGRFKKRHLRARRAIGRDRTGTLPWLLAAIGVLVGAAMPLAHAHADELAAPAQPRLEVGGGAELTLVGLAGGLRAEALFRPGAAHTRSRIRLAPGLLFGPEFSYVPVAVGYRAVFRGDAWLRPEAGAGFEFQQRWVSDAAPVRQLAFYVEAGLQAAVGQGWSAGLQTSVDWAFLGPAGPGLVVRLVVVRTLD